jgi:hypothetical protein
MMVVKVYLNALCFFKGLALEKESKKTSPPFPAQITLNGDKSGGEFFLQIIILDRSISMIYNVLKRKC